MVRLANICKSLRVPQCSNAAGPRITEKAEHASTRWVSPGVCIEADKCPMELECSTLTPPSQWWRNPSLWVISTVLIIVGPMVVLASAGVISSVADRVYVALVLAMDIGMVGAIMHRSSAQNAIYEPVDGHRLDSDVSISQEGLATESAHFQLAQYYLTFCHLVLPLEICYAVTFASSPVLVAIGVAVLVTLVLQWLWRMLIMQTSACIMDDLNAPIPEVLKRNPFFDAASTVSTIAMTGVGVSRFILMS